MSEQSIVTIVLGIIGLATSTGLWTWVSSKRKEPISTATALTAMAARTQSMTMVLTEALRDEMKRDKEEFQEEIAKIRAEHALDRAALRDLQIQMDVLIQTWDTWYRGLVERWEVLRADKTPPPPPETSRARFSERNTR